MAALPHATGLFRAYKKIHGKEHQTYFKTLEEAQAKQDTYDTIVALKAKKVIADRGHLIGFRFIVEYRKGRKKRIYMNVQLKINGTSVRKQFGYKDNFEVIWKKILLLWKELHNLTSADMAAYHQEIKQAKRIYLNDLSKLL